MAMTAQESQIAALFVSYFNRSPDPAGLGYWATQLEGGMSLSSIASSFATQPEATNLYPFLANPTAGGQSPQSALLSSVYSNPFGREIDPAGLAYWNSQVSSGKALGGIIQNMISGAQGNDLATLNNKIQVGVEYAQHFTEINATWAPSDIATSKSVLSGVTFQSSTLSAAEAKIKDIAPLPPPANITRKPVDASIPFPPLFPHPTP